MKFKGESYFAVALLIFFLVLLGLTFGYRPRARLLPLIIFPIMIALICLQILITSVPAIEKRLEFLKSTELFEIQKEPSEKKEIGLEQKNSKNGTG